jgi:DNA-binding phage protein
VDDIGREIKKILKKKGLSVYRMAKDLRIADESLYRSLAKGANPEWRRIKQILNYLDYGIVLKAKKKKK